MRNFNYFDVVFALLLEYSRLAVRIKTAFGCVDVSHLTAEGSLASYF